MLALDWPAGNGQFHGKSVVQLRMESDRPEPMPVARQIIEALKAQIAGGAYAAGDRLPSTRALAAELGVSRTTVTAAYEQLLAEGYLETRQGARAQVARTLRRATATAEPPPGDGVSPAPLSRYGRAIAGFQRPETRPPGRLVADFRHGVLAAADFPMPGWKRALNAALLQRPEPLRYGDPRGSPALRLALQGYLWRARGLRCEADQIIVVNGSQQGLDLCARLLIDPGDRAVVEDPCYLQARQILLAAGADLIPIAVDQEGMRTEPLEAVGAARLAFVTPSHQFPLGAVLTAGRRQALLAWARRQGAYVIEDDYDSEYRFDTAPIPPLHALGGADHVIYLGTVSKTLSPLLRLGYLVVPPALGEAFATAKHLADRHAPSLEQSALAGFIASGAYERHVRQARRRNAERRAALLATLKAELGARVGVVGADAGLHVVAWLPEIPEDREPELIARGRAAGIGLYPVSPFYAGAGSAGRPGCAGLVLGYASLTPAEIQAGVRLLAELLGRRGSVRA
jgi:GntR family transcriptional regulator/MocR family aminotransferase